MTSCLHHQCHQHDHHDQTAPRICHGKDAWVLTAHALHAGTWHDPKEEAAARWLGPNLSSWNRKKFAIHAFHISPPILWFVLNCMLYLIHIHVLKCCPLIFQLITIMPWSFSGSIWPQRMYKSRSQRSTSRRFFADLLFPWQSTAKETRKQTFSSKVYAFQNKLENKVFKRTWKIWSNLNWETPPHNRNRRSFNPETIRDMRALPSPSTATTHFGDIRTERRYQRLLAHLSRVPATCCTWER